jgi:integrase
MLSRRRRQKGSVRLRGRRTRFWEGIYWQDVLDQNGQITRRKQRFIKLGYPSELPTEKAALRKLDDILREVNAPDYEPESQVTLGEFINQAYIPIELRTKSHSTARNVKNALKKYVIPKFGRQQMTHIQKLVVKHYFLDLLDESGLSWNSVNKIKNYMSDVYSTAIDSECGVKFNPVRGIKLPPPIPVAVVESSVLLSDEDVVRIEEALPDELTRTVWWLAAATGIRKGEIRALRRMGSIDWEAGQLLITRSRF